jgi:hypothetical protein
MGIANGVKPGNPTRLAGAGIYMSTEVELCFANSTANCESFKGSGFCVVLKF